MCIRDSLYYDNGKKLETTSDGVLVSQATGNAYLKIKALENDAGSSARLRIETANNDANSVLEFGDPDDPDVGKILYNHQTSGSDIMTFSIAASEKWRMTSGGDFANNNDTGKIILGAGADLQIYHNGSNSFIKKVSSGTGDLFFDTDGSSDLYLRAGDGSTGAYISVRCYSNAGVDLRYQNTKKFETTTNGASVTGSLGIGTASPDSVLNCYKSCLLYTSPSPRDS